MYNKHIHSNKFLLVTLISTLVVNIMATDLPPMPPIMQQQKKSTKAKEKKWQRPDLQSVPACTSLPPMIIFLPPPMEKELIACRNVYFKPSLKEASYKLSKTYKKKLKVTKIEVIEGFREVYKVYIKDNKKQYTRYCNKDMNSCLK